MVQIIFRIIGLGLIMSGVVMIYDARIITKKWFGFGDQNEASLGFKLLGGIVSILGAILVYVTKIF